MGIDVICLSLIMLLERIKPRRKYSFFKRGMWKDVSIALLNIYIGPQLYQFFPGGEAFFKNWLPWGVDSLPFWAEFLIALIIADFARYLVHLSMHRIRFCWNIHKLHHSAEEVSATSGYRNGYSEDLLLIIFIIIPMLILKVSPEVVDHLFLIFGIHGFFLHSNIDFKMPRILRFIACPHFHQWHHVKKTQLPGSQNIGATFTFWDKMFNTYIFPDELPTDFGLAKEAELKYNFLSEYFYPFNLPFQWIYEKLNSDKKDTPS